MGELCYCLGDFSLLMRWWYLLFLPSYTLLATSIIFFIIFLYHTYIDKSELLFVFIPSNIGMGIGMVKGNGVGFSYV